MGKGLTTTGNVPCATEIPWRVRSWNHGMVWVGRELKAHPVSPPTIQGCSKPRPTKPKGFQRVQNPFVLKAVGLEGGEQDIGLAGMCGVPGWYPGSGNTL